MEEEDDEDENDDGGCGCGYESCRAFRSGTSWSDLRKHGLMVWILKDEEDGDDDDDDDDDGW